jgi:hypothetical protein
MRIRKRRMRWGRSEIAQGVDQWIGIFLAIVICFFALQQSYGAQNMHDITQAEPDHLAVHTMERQQGSFLDILGRSELTQLEQARLTVSARITRLNAERNVQADLPGMLPEFIWHPAVSKTYLCAAMRGLWHTYTGRMGKKLLTL